MLGQNRWDKGNYDEDLQHDVKVKKAHKNNILVIFLLDPINQKLLYLTC